MIFFKRRQYKKREETLRTTKNKTYSYHSARRGPENSGNINQPKDQTSTSSSKLSKFLNAVTLLAVFSSLGYLSYVNTEPIIELDQNAIPRNEADYYRAVENEINSSVIYKNKLSFSIDQFSSRIKTQFPEIDNVTVEIPVFRHRPTINISVAEPSARLITNDKVYILNGEGKALFEESQINDQYDTSKLVSINDSSGHPITLGKPVLTEQQIVYIREIINQSNASNVPAKSFNLEFGGSAVDVKYQNADYIVKYSFYEDPKQSSGAYFAIREEINSGNVTSPKQYIDLRIPDRAYIK